MTLLILGLALFFAPHVLIKLFGLRDGLVGRLGENGYRGAYSLASIAGLALIVIGYEPAAPRFTIDAARPLTHALMPLSFILLAGANMKSNLKRYVSHPMSLGVLIWAVLHLLNNPHPAAYALFGSFAGFALLNIFVTGGRPARPEPQPIKKDVILVVAGLVAYAVVLWAHGAVFGRPVVG